MRYLLKKYFILIISVYLLTQLIPTFNISGGWQGLCYSCLILSLLFYIAAPIVNLIMLPFNLLTLNLTSWLLNILLLYIWTLLVSEIHITSWQFSGVSFGLIILSSANLARWQVIIIAGILLTLIIQFISWLVK